ncbi:MAG: PD-(D/E)XK nuclease family protein [Bdellovibrionales bacterium]|nr:PD-(D/E)XK nuclease family protein [Bdellovibrionales bacterium]
MFEKIMGFQPTATLVIGSGLTREDWKTFCFQQGKGLLQRAILKPRDLALQLVPEANSRLLNPIARQELLRQSLRDPNVKEALPGLREHRFRPRFYEILDRSLQQGRMRFVHHEEAQVFQSVLEEKSGRNVKREEYFLLNRFWDRLLELRELWDEPRLYSDAVRRMPLFEPSPALQKIYYIRHFPDPPRVQSFWQALSERAEVEIRLSFDETKAPSEIPVERRTAHSLEDAALFLMDEFRSNADLDRIAIVIEDKPVVRRTLRRVASQRGIPLQDARDPMLVSVDENLKVALLEFEIVAKGFPIEATLEWVRLTRTPFVDREAIRKRLLDKGMSETLGQYKEFTEAVRVLRERYPSRMALSQIHAEVVKRLPISKTDARTIATLDRFFRDWIGSLDPLKMQHRKQPIRYWFDQVQDRLQKAPPQVEPFRHRRGLKIYRVDQAVNVHLAPEATQVYFFGVSAQFFEPILKGEEWFTPSDIETLSKEFSLPSRRDLQAQNLKSFLAWAASSGAGTVQSFEWEFDEAGGESEPIDLGLALIAQIRAEEPVSLGAHPLNLNSLQATRMKSVDHVEARLPKTEWPISFVNAYGDCPFKAYAGYLLQLTDEEDPDFDLRPTDLGSLIHKALEILMKAEIDGVFITPEWAFDKAWAERKPLGWLKSDRMFDAIKAGVVTRLKRFLDDEREYRARSGTVPFKIEYEFTSAVEGLMLKGRADRIDKHDDGLVLVDYKTSSTLTSAQKSLQTGKSLQLSIYALGLRENLKQEMIGATYLQLTPKKVSRTHGVYFQKWNKGKKADVVDKPISEWTKANRSLFQDEPEAVWSQFNELVKTKVSGIKTGNFSPKPADPNDCDVCSFKGVCGVMRRASIIAEDVE